MILRDVPTELQNHLNDDVNTMASCWKITRTDGSIFRFTDADISVQLSDGEYIPMDSGKPSSIEETIDINSSNLTIQQLISSEQITVDDLNSGLFDEAKVEIYWVNYQNPSQGAITLFIGYFGEVKINDDIEFEVELKSLSTKLEQTVGRQYTQQCDAALGDSRCGVITSSYTYNGTVTSITDNQIFTDSSISAINDYYKYGKLTWTSGNNNGASIEVKNQIGGEITLLLAMPFTIQVGDTFDVVAGCDKYFDTCKDKFNNVINFRGFPHIPGNDSISQYPDAKG